MNFSKVGRQPEKIQGSMTPSIKVSFYSLRRPKTVSAADLLLKNPYDCLCILRKYGLKIGVKLKTALGSALCPYTYRTIKRLHILRRWI